MAEERPDDVKRANFIGVPDFYNLNLICAEIFQAFDEVPYLVGSSLETRNFRDVDIRIILGNDHYERLFPGLSGNPQVSALWSLFCVAISEWMSRRTCLPIDFQIQRQSEANKEFRGKRQPLGVFISHATDKRK